MSTIHFFICALVLFLHTSRSTNQGSSLSILRLATISFYKSSFGVKKVFAVQHSQAVLSALMYNELLVFSNSFKFSVVSVSLAWPMVFATLLKSSKK